MNLLSLFTRFFAHEDEVMLDHIPVQRKNGKANVAAKKLAAARELAAKRHGKPFHCDSVKPRETPPSPTLESLAALSKPETVIVVPDNVARLQIGGAK